MAKKDIFIFQPTWENFAPEQIKMWRVMEPHIKAQVHQLPLPDLLLFAYLLGLGHMQDALIKTTETKDTHHDNK